jgi:hypothetical protein
MPLAEANQSFVAEANQLFVRSSLWMPLAEANQSFVPVIPSNAISRS